MLRLIIGRAGSGKTAAVIAEIDEAVRAKRAGSLLIVPEQYSHEAEREVCARCGDSLSLYAESGAGRPRPGSIRAEGCCAWPLPSRRSPRA